VFRAFGSDPAKNLQKFLPVFMENSQKAVAITPVSERRAVG
jgi:hypothetical protein